MFVFPLCADMCTCFAVLLLFCLWVAIGCDSVRWGLCLFGRHLRKVFGLVNRGGSARSLNISVRFALPTLSRQRHCNLSWGSGVRYACKLVSDSGTFFVNCFTCFTPQNCRWQATSKAPFQSGRNFEPEPSKDGLLCGRQVRRVEEVRGKPNRTREPPYMLYIIVHKLFRHLYMHIYTGFDVLVHVCVRAFMQNSPCPAGLNPQYYVPRFEKNTTAQRETRRGEAGSSGERPSLASCFTLFSSWGPGVGATGIGH